MPTNPGVTRNEKLDILSGIAILWVVFIHALVQYFRYALGVPDDKVFAYCDDYFLKTIRFCMRTGVPLFVFISGYKFFLSKYDSLPFKTLLKKRLFRIGKPMLVMSFVYMIINIAIQSAKVLKASSFSFTAEAQTKIFSILTEHALGYPLIWFGKKVASHFWFLPMILFVSLTYPLIIWIAKKVCSSHKVISKKLNPTYIRLLICSLLYFYCAIYVTQDVLDFPKYFIFFELGYLCASCEWKFEKNKAVTLVIINLIFLGYSVTVTDFGRHLSLLAISNFLHIFSYFYIVNTINTDTKIFTPLKKAGLFSFQIFLFHYPFMLWFMATGLKKFGLLKSGLGVTFMVITAMILCVVITKLVQKLKLEKLIF